MNPYLEAIIETNPDSLAIAAELDGERRAGTTRGPLHGIPVLVKDVCDSCSIEATTFIHLILILEYGNVR